jgi:hypothetical protein
MRTRFSMNGFVSSHGAEAPCYVPHTPDADSAARVSADAPPRRDARTARSSLASRIGGGGTGSNPWPPRGWHRDRRTTPNQAPRSTPYRATASAMYSEQEGVNRHAPVKSGEIRIL